MQICHRKADVSSVSPLLDWLKECGLCVVYKIGVAQMKGEGRSFWVYYWGVGGLVVFFPVYGQIADGPIRRRQLADGFKVVSLQIYSLQHESIRYTS